MTFYSMRSHDGGFSITKFDADLNPLDTYQVSPDACTCPAGVRPSCRHRQMLPVFIAADAIDQPMFWSFEEQAWFRLDEPSSEPSPIPEPSQPDLPFGITLLDLTDTRALHNAIADAVGEPQVSPQPSPIFRPRRI